MNSLLLPVRPHVLKYLQCQLGERYFLSEADPYGLLLFNLLRRPLTDARCDHVLRTYPQTWHVGLGTYGQMYAFREPTGKSVYQFNSFVHALLMEKLYDWVELATDHGQQAKFAIEGFMARYGLLEEDIQFDTLKKAWQRYLAGRPASKRRVASLTGRLHLKELEKRLRAVA